MPKVIMKACPEHLTLRPWLSQISNDHDFPDAEQCLMCRHDLPHNAAEHAEIVKHGLKGHGKSAVYDWHTKGCADRFRKVAAAKNAERAARKKQVH